MLPICAIGYASGIVVAATCGAPAASAWLALALAGASLALFRRVPVVALLLLGLSMVPLGAARARRSAALHAGRCELAGWPPSPSLRLWLTVDREPIWAADRQRQRATVWAAAADGRAPARACGSVELTRPRADLPLWPPQSLVARGRWRPAAERPSTGRPADAGQDSGVSHASPVGYLSTTEADVVRIGVVRPRWHHGFRHQLRLAIERAVPDEAARALLAALVIGDGARLSTAQRDRFGRSGLAHLLAVSGLHLVLVAMAVVALLEALLRRCAAIAARTVVRRWAALAGIAAAVVYTALTGGGAATERSCVMMVAALAGVVLGRPRELVRPLALAALVLLANDPTVLWQAGFQLSFAAVIGLALAARHPLGAALRQRSWAVRASGGLLLASLSASAATAAVTAFHFQTISIMSPLANLLGVPFVSCFVLPVALLGALLGTVAPVAGTVLIQAAAHGTRWLDWFSAVVATPSWAALSVSLSGLGLVTLVAASLALLVSGPAARRGFALVALVALIAGPLATRWSRERRVTVALLDAAGRGVALLRMPDGETILFGAGRSPVAGEGSRQALVRWLRRAAIGRIDHVVLTGEGPDEVGGLVALLGAVEVRELWLRAEEGVTAELATRLRWIAPRPLRIGRPRPLVGRDWRIAPLLCQVAPPPRGHRSRATPDRSPTPRLALLLRHGRALVALGASAELASCLPDGALLLQSTPQSLRWARDARSAGSQRLPGGVPVADLAPPARGALVVELSAVGRLWMRTGPVSGPQALGFDG